MKRTSDKEGCVSLAEIQSSPIAVDIAVVDTLLQWNGLHVLLAVPLLPGNNPTEIAKMFNRETKYLIKRASKLALSELYAASKLIQSKLEAGQTITN